jgi:hypothetical protein
MACHPEECPLVSSPQRIKTRLAATLITAILVSTATSATAADALTLMLPSTATIKLVNLQTISGIRLAAMGPSAVSYEQGGQRSLPLRQVESISFTGPIKLKAKEGPTVRGEAPKGCRGPRQILLASTALVVQPNGVAMALDPATLDTTQRKDLQQTSVFNTLVVDTLRFDPSGKVQLAYKACSASR